MLHRPLAQNWVQTLYPAPTPSILTLTDAAAPVIAVVGADRMTGFAVRRVSVRAPDVYHRPLRYAASRQT